MPLDTFHWPEAARLVQGIAGEFGLWMPEETKPQ